MAMTSMRRDGRRIRALPSLLAGALLLTAGVGFASANSVPHPDLQMNLFTPTATMPADTAFWVGHGFSTASQELPSAIVRASAVFELYVDGSPVALRRDVEFEGGEAVESVGMIWYRNFEMGLPAGEHHFEGRWYVYGGLFMNLEADILFE
jgi:hypothetical protein